MWLLCDTLCPDQPLSLPLQTSPTNKLLALLLIDSIIKNESDGAGAKYRELFEMKIIPIFTHIFMEVSGDARRA